MCEPPRLIAVAAVDYLRAGPKQMVMLMRRAKRRAADTLDVTVDVPVLVVRGADDLVCSQVWCERLVAIAPDGRLVVLPDSSHGVAFAPPDSLVTLLREEVAAADAARG